MSTNKGLEEIFNKISLFVNIYALLVTVIGVLLSTKRIGRFWKTRHIRKVWGIKDGDYVIVVCSELDKPAKRQNVEPREFIYNLKYGDVDAYFEVVVTLLRLFPKIKLHIMSSGEAETRHIDLSQHLILVGGPDYNIITTEFLNKKITRYQYKSPDFGEPSKSFPKEIVIYDSIKKQEFCEVTDKKDYGYFERIKNPLNPKKKIIFLGGSHTIGVTGAVKAFSMFDSEQGEIPETVLLNAKKVAKKTPKESEFSVLFIVERVGQTINTPTVKEDLILIK